MANIHQGSIRIHGAKRLSLVEDHASGVTWTSLIVDDDDEVATFFVGRSNEEYLRRLAKAIDAVNAEFNEKLES